jgi:hypothetical protein
MLFERTARNQSAKSLDNSVITKNKEQSIRFPRNSVHSLENWSLSLTPKKIQKGISYIVFLENKKNWIVIGLQLDFVKKNPSKTVQSHLARMRVP